MGENSNQVELPGLQRSFCAAGNIQLAIDLFKVILDGIFTDAKLFSRVWRAGTAGYQLEHIALAFG